LLADAITFYSPSPEYPVACYRDEWSGEPRLKPARHGRASEGVLASAQFRFDTPQLAAGSFIYVNRYILDIYKKRQSITALPFMTDNRF
jgi:hypothetical protein